MAAKKKSYKFDSANDPKRPLRLKCSGGPLSMMSVYEQVPTTHVPVPDETGNRIAGQYVLDGSTYRWEPQA